MSVLKKNILFNLIGQTSVMILGFISFKYIYSGLGDDALGIIYFSLMLSALLTSALDMGLSKTTIREIAAHYSSDPGYIKDLTQTFSLFFWSGYLLAASAFVLFLPEIVDSWINLATMDRELAHYVLFVIGITSLLAIPKAFMGSICIGMQRMDINNAIDVSVAIIQQFGLVLLLVYGHDIIAVAYWLAATNILRILTYLVFISRWLSFGALFPWFSMDVIIRIKEYTSKMVWVSLLLVIHKQLDKVLISKFLPIGILGIYSFAYNSIGKTALITSAVAQAVFPSFSELDSKQKRKNLLEKFFTLQDLLIWGTVPIFALVVFLAMPVFTFLLDESKAEMLQLPVLLLCISFYLNATLRMMSTYVSATGKPEYIIKSNLLALIIVTPLTIILIIKAGILGAALSWVVYYLTGAAYIVPMIYKRELNQSAYLWFKSVITVFLLVCLTYFPAWCLANTYFSKNLLFALLCYIFGTVVYTVIALNLTGKGLRKIVLSYMPSAKTLIAAISRG